MKTISRKKEKPLFYPTIFLNERSEFLPDKREVKALKLGKNHLLPFLLLVAWLFGAVSLARAGTTGKIAGRVMDASTGEPLIGANVYLEGHPYGAATDTDGFYFILNVPPGTYTVVAQMLNYQEVRATRVVVKIDLTTRLDFKLQPTTLELGEEITVVAERPMVQKDVTSTSVSVSHEEIKAMPVEHFNEVVNLQAGVIGGHFRGGRLGEVAYMVDGIPVNDPYNNSAAIEVENSSIQELEVISGTFNAEYGQAMSGVVNIVTRDGSQKFESNISAYLGNYLTTHDRIFPNLKPGEGGRSGNLQFIVSGPIPFFRKITFFLTGRYFRDNGYIYGRRVYNTTDNDPYRPTGDSAWVPMNDYTRYSLHGKLSYFISPTIKLSYSLLWDDNTNHYYNHAFRLTPDGIMNHYRTNWHQNIILNHTINKHSFHTLKLSRNYSEYKGYLYEDPYDPRYVIPEQGLPQSAYTFRSGGNEPGRYHRTTTTDLLKWDFTSQISRQHKIGIGLQYKTDDLYNFSTAFRAGPDSSTIIYPEKYTPGWEEYNKKPYEFAAYLQDKMEYEDFIVNLGIRFDYFNPNTDIPSDPRNPHYNPLFPSGVEKAKTQYQVSPRLGIAFPISAHGVIHGSYGHFFQIPNRQQLYQGIYTRPDGKPSFTIVSETGEQTAYSVIVGNPNLKAESTVKYEVGLKQALTTNLAIELTAYYSDIRNLVDTELLETYDGKKYARYTNRDYANVRGIIVSVEKRFSRHWGATVDYTFQYAEGNASDPLSVFLDNQTNPPLEPEKKLIPLDWDQRHTLNFSLTVGSRGNYLVSLIGRFGSGMPYTADRFFNPVDITFRNNRRKPATYTFDLRAEKHFKVWGARFSAFILVYNLFDRLNEYGVYPSSGRAGVDYNVKFAGDIYGLNTIEEYVLNPAMYGAPRQIRIGLNLEL